MNSQKPRVFTPVTDSKLIFCNFYRILLTTRETIKRKSVDEDDRETPCFE